MTFDLSKLPFLRTEMDGLTMKVYGGEILTAEEKEFCIAFWAQVGVYSRYKIEWCSNTVALIQER